MGGEYATDIVYPVHFVPDSTSSSIEKGTKAYVSFNASGTGWELLKRSLFFKFSPAEIPLSTVKGEHIVATRLGIALWQFPGRLTDRTGSDRSVS